MQQPVSYALETNHRDFRYFRYVRMDLARRFASHDPKLATVPQNRYPEAHATLKKILAGHRVSDFELEWTAGVVEGIRRIRRSK